MQNQNLLKKQKIVEIKNTTTRIISALISLLLKKHVFTLFSNILEVDGVFF